MNVIDYSIIFDIRSVRIMLSTKINIVGIYAYFDIELNN